MKRLLACLAGVVTLTASGCVYAFLADTPTRVIHRSVSCPNTAQAKAKGFQVLGTHRWSKGVVILYSALCPSGDTKTSMQQVFGHQVVKRNGMNWQVSSTDSYGISRAKKPSEKLIEYGVSRIGTTEGDSQGKKDAAPASNEAERYTILYGQMLMPKVAAVEATFDNGQIVRDNGKSGVFALISPGAAGVCELRILGSDNQILRREELLPPYGLQVPRKLVKARRSPAKCLPISNQM